jgi:predicted aminopeptidase
MADIGAGRPLTPKAPPVAVTFSPTKAERKAQFRALTAQPRAIVKQFGALNAEQRQAQIDDFLDQLEQSYAPLLESTAGKADPDKLRAHQSKMTAELMKMADPDRVP